jgi:hypothetical protein
MKCKYIQVAEKELGIGESLYGFSSWLSSVIDLIPKEHRENSFIEFSHYESCGGTILIEVAYTRPYTPQDAKEDLGRKLANTEKEERETLKKLYKKYGAPE